MENLRMQDKKDPLFGENGVIFEELPWIEPTIGFGNVPNPELLLPDYAEALFRIVREEAVKGG
jgi:hypothetical protein